MAANRRKSEPWPENNEAFMRTIGDGFLEDTGQDIGVWLDRADGFRWAADIIVRWANSDVASRETRGRSDSRGPDFLQALFDQSDKEVEDRLVCRSYELGPVNWFGLSCAVGTLYRHYIELLLKVIVILLRRLEHQESSFPMTHDLKVLWAEATARGLDSGGADTDALSRATSHIRWLSERDPSSQVFRYPAAEGLSRDKVLPLMEELVHHVVPLGNYLRQVAEGFWDVRGQQRDTEEDMAGNIPDSPL